MARTGEEVVIPRKPNYVGFAGRGRSKTLSTVQYIALMELKRQKEYRRKEDARQYITAVSVIAMFTFLQSLFCTLLIYFIRY